MRYCVSCVILFIHDYQPAGRNRIGAEIGNQLDVSID